MHCPQCGQMLPPTAPKFCPQCGAQVKQPQAPVTPGAGGALPGAGPVGAPPLGPQGRGGAQGAAMPSAPSVPWGVGPAGALPYGPQGAGPYGAQGAQPVARAWNDPVNKPVWITVGLFVAAWITWAGGSPGAIGALLWLAALVALVLDTAAPAWWTQLPLPVWLRRPMLGSIASGVFVLTTALGSGLTLGWLFWAAATVVFLRDSFRRSELGSFDPRLLLRGWRMLLLIGITLASFSFAASWEPKINVSGYTSYENRFDGSRWRVWNSGYSMGGQANAHAQGKATVPALLMLSVLVWAAYKGNHPVARWARFVPAALIPIFIILAYRASVPPDWVKENEMAFGMQAEGPGYFIVGMLPYYVGAVALALGFDHWRKASQ